MRMTVGRMFTGIALALVVGAGRAGADCSDLPEQCSSAEACDETLDGVSAAHFQIEFLGRSYDAMADETTFEYQVCSLIQNPNLGHWVLGLCPTLQGAVVDATPANGGNGVVAPDTQTCLDGYKFNVTGGVPDCDGMCPGGSGSGQVFTITFAGDVATAIVPAGVTVATRAGSIVDDTCLIGPACAVATTTTTTSTTTTTTTSTTTTSTTTTSTTTTTTTTTSTTTTSSTTTSTTTSSTTTTEASTTTTTTNGSSTTEAPTTTTTSTTEAPTTTTTTTEAPTTTTTTTEVPTTTTSSTTTSSTTTTEATTTTTTSTTEAPTTTTTTSTSTTSSTTTTVPQCTDDSQCDDLNVCTDDHCMNGVCVSVPIPPSGTEGVCNDMADQDCDGLVDCDDPDCVDTAPCPPIRRDPSRIVLGRDGAPDKFSSHGRIEPRNRVDPSTVEIGWMLTNGRGAIWRGALIPGDLRPNRDRTDFRFYDATARNGRGHRFGISKVKIRKTRNGSSYGYRIEAYGDFSAAGEDMALQFYVGDENFIFDEPWLSRSWGWRSRPFSR
jgi:hypothetical protein